MIYYLAPTGKDTNIGTIASPWFTLQKAWTNLLPGDIVYMRGGTYTYSVQQYLITKNGTSTNNIKVHAYNDEKPIITRAALFSKPGNYWHRGMVVLSGNFIHIKGIRFTGMYTDDNQVDAGLQTWDVNNCIFEMLECDNNVEGMIIENNSSNNLVLNSDFHDNYSNYGGSNGGNSDGLGITYVQPNTTNTVRGCRAWNNGDDGFDTFEDRGYVRLENCWSWHNGYNKGTTTPAGNGVGFKLGSVFLAGNTLSNTVLRKLTNCISADNRDAGYHSNEGILRCELFNTVSYKNGNTGYHFHYGNLIHTFTNNISLANGNWDVEISSVSVSKNNSFGGQSDGGSGWQKTASSSDFVSLDVSQLIRPRKADGSLPDITAFTLATGSDMIDTGINVGLPFNGTAPDRGAFEYGSVSITTTTTKSPITTSTTTTTTKVPITTSTTTSTTKVPTTSTTSTTTKSPKIVKTANNNLSTKRLVITFTDGTTKTISNSTKSIKTVLTDYVTKQVIVTYSDGTSVIF